MARFGRTGWHVVQSYWDQGGVGGREGFFFPFSIPPTFSFQPLTSHPAVGAIMSPDATGSGQLP